MTINGQSIVVEQAKLRPRKVKPSLFLNTEERKDLKKILAAYLDVIPSSLDSTRGRAKKNVSELIKVVGAKKLLKAVRGYKEHCEKSGCEMKYRKRCGNFFGIGRDWEQFADVEMLVEQTMSDEEEEEALKIERMICQK